MAFNSLLIFLIAAAAVLAYLATGSQTPKILGLAYFNFQGQRIFHMQVTPDAPLQLLVKGLDRVGNTVELPAGVTPQSTVADTTVATASQSADGKTVTVTEVRIGNTTLDGVAGSLTGSITLECVGGAPVSLAYVPLASARR